MQGHFPEAEKDSVIQIASLVSVHGQTEPAVKNIITLDTCASIVGAEVSACLVCCPRIYVLLSQRALARYHIMFDCMASVVQSSR